MSKKNALCSRCFSYRTTYQHNLCWNCLNELQDENNLEIWVQKTTVEKEIRELTAPEGKIEKERRIRENIIVLGLLANISRRSINQRLIASGCTGKWTKGLAEEVLGPEKYAVWQAEKGQY